MPTKKQRRGALSTEIHARDPNELKITVEAPLGILAVIGALQRDSTSSGVIGTYCGSMREAGCLVDMLDFKKEPWSLFILI